MKVEPHTKTTVMEKNVPFYWDIYAVAVDEDIDIVLTFTDMNDYPYDFKHTFRVT